MIWACNGRGDTPCCAESSLRRVQSVASGLPCLPVAETLPRRDETQFSEKVRAQTVKCIVYCTCGTCLRPTDKTRKLNRDPLDVVSIPNCVKKKGPSHGARHGNTDRPRIYHAAHVAGKKANKRDTTLCWHDFKIVQLQSVTDRGWNEEFCAHSDAIAKEDHSYVATAEDRKDMSIDGYWYSTAKGKTVR